MDITSAVIRRSWPAVCPPNAVAGPRIAHDAGRLGRFQGSGPWAGRGPSGVCSGVWNAGRLPRQNPIEPVSTVKFPANREINREFRRIRLLGTILKADTRANSEACSEIPYAIRTWNYFG